MAENETGAPETANPSPAEEHFAKSMGQKVPTPAPEVVKVDAPVDPPKEEPAKAEEPAEAETDEPEGDEQSDEDQEDTEEEPHARKRRSLKKDNIRLTRKNRELREQLAALRPAAVPQAQTQPVKVEQATPETKRPKQEDFSDYDAYMEAVVDWKADLKLQAVEDKRRQGEQQRQETERRTSAMSKIDQSEVKARAKYDDYDDVARNDDVRITPAMVDLMSEMDEPAEIAYWLGNNPQEALRISNLSPQRVAIELGKIEARLGTQEAPKPVAVKPSQETKAPPPTRTVSGGTSRAAKPLEAETQEMFFQRRMQGLKSQR